MQLSANPVDWKRVVDLNREGTLEDVMRSEDADVDALFIPNAPWPSDSCNEYMEVAEAYAAIKAKVPPGTRAAADSIMSSLINEDYRFPQDLGDGVDSELIAGALSPDRVRSLAAAFGAVDFADLDEAFARHLPDALRTSLQICADGRGREAFTRYLRQWKDLLEYARNRDAGVLLHMG
jgi:hypothetical protein